MTPITYTFTDDDGDQLIVDVTSRFVLLTARLALSRAVSVSLTPDDVVTLIDVLGEMFVP